MKPKAQPHFTPGSKDESDPDWLESRMTADEIEAMLARVEANRDTRAIVPAPPKSRRATVSAPALSSWHLQLLNSLREQVDRHRALGREKLLTGRQLVVLCIMHHRIAAAATAVLERSES